MALIDTILAKIRFVVRTNISRVRPKRKEFVALKRRFRPIFVGKAIGYSLYEDKRSRLVARGRFVIRAGICRRLDEDSTGKPRNIHKLSCERSYSGVVMRGAFVVQLRNVGREATRGMEGSVEEVDTGKESYFRSEDELVAFLRECFAQSCQRASPNEGTK
jgi:hypothetical protein